HGWPTARRRRHDAGNETRRTVQHGLMPSLFLQKSHASAWLFCWCLPSPGGFEALLSPNALLRPELPYSMGAPSPLSYSGEWKIGRHPVTAYRWPRRNWPLPNSVVHWHEPSATHQNRYYCQTTDTRIVRGLARPPNAGSVH